jgi:hypothetical protein
MRACLCSSSSIITSSNSTITAANVYYYTIAVHCGQILADHNKLAVTKGVLELLQIMLALKGALLTAVPSDNTDTANNSTGTL